MSYREELRVALLNAGIDGVSKTNLTIALRNIADAEMIEEELEALHKKGVIQKFVIQSKRKGGPPKTIWRATTKLLEV